MTDPGGSFEYLKALVESSLGLTLTRGGTSEALQRYAQQRFPTFDRAGMDGLLRMGTKAYDELVDAVTVQHSWLFRDCEQLEAACSTLQALGPDRQPARVWVPACATGEDAYSIAAIADALHVPATILGTDVNRAAVQCSERGCYGSWSTHDVPTRYRSALGAVSSGCRPVVERLRTSTRFAVHNLLDSAPRSASADGRWDLIVCRNVLIYLSPPAVRRAIELVCSVLAPAGTLVLGASDILAELPEGLQAFELGGRIAFRRGGPGQILRPPSSRAAVAAPASPPLRAAPRQLLPRITTSQSAVHRSTPAKGASPASALAVEQDAELALEHLMNGIALHLGGELREGVRELRAALYLLPTLWPAAYYLALSSEGLGRPDEARRYYARVVELLGSPDWISSIQGHDFVFLEKDVARVARRRSGQDGR
jgi:chemotaxis protein methyltransferase CheR